MWWCNYGGLYGAAHCAQYSIYSCLVINLPSATTSRSQLGIRSTAIADWCSHIGPVHLERRRSYRRERAARCSGGAHHPTHIGDEAMRIHRREWGADGTGGSWLCGRYTLKGSIYVRAAAEHCLSLLWRRRSRDRTGGPKCIAFWKRARKTVAAYEMANRNE